MRKVLFLSFEQNSNNSFQECLEFGKNIKETHYTDLCLDVSLLPYERLMFYILLSFTLVQLNRKKWQIR